jgi:hypothetical protein
MIPTDLYGHGADLLGQVGLPPFWDVSERMGKLLYTSALDDETDIKELNQTQDRPTKTQYLISETGDPAGHISTVLGISLPESIQQQFFFIGGNLVIEYKNPHKNRQTEKGKRCPDKAQIQKQGGHIHGMPEIPVNSFALQLGRAFFLVEDHSVAATDKNKSHSQAYRGQRKANVPGGDGSQKK